MTVPARSATTDGFGAEIAWLEAFADPERDAVLVAELDGRITMGNGPAVALIDLDRARQGDGPPHLALLVDPDRHHPELLDHLCRQAASLQPWRAACPVPLRGTGLTPVDAVVLPITDESGELMGIALILRDLAAHAAHAAHAADTDTQALHAQALHAQALDTGGSDPFDRAPRANRADETPPAAAAELDFADGRAALLQWIGRASHATPSAEPAQSSGAGDADRPTDGALARLRRAAEGTASFDDVLASELCDGSLTGLATALEDVRRSAVVDESWSTTEPVVARLLRLDGLARSGRATPDDLHRAYRCLAPDADIELHRWLAAIATEQHLWRGELTGLLVALAALRASPAPSTRLGLVNRGRLLRMVAIAELLGAGNHHEVEGRLGPAQRDFEAAGAIEELCFTTVLATLAMAVALDDVPGREPSTVMSDAADDLAARGSSRVGMALIAGAWLGATRRDAEIIHTFRGRYGELTNTIAGAEPADHWPLLDAMHAVLASVEALLRWTDSDCPIQLADDATATVEALRQTFSAATATQLLVAGLLLDHGHTERASRLLRHLRGDQIAHPVARSSVHLQSARLAVQRTEPDAWGAFESAIAEVQSLGSARLEAYAWLRGARDLARAGGPISVVVAARRRGARLLGQPANSYEAFLLLPVATASNELVPELAHHEHSTSRLPHGDLSLADNRIEVLGPDLAVWRHGQPVILSPLHHALLTELVCARTAVTVDWLVDRLWPDASLETGRNRLKAQLHNLRRTLQVGTGDLIIRTSNGLQLEPGDHWTVDLWELLGLAGSPADPGRIVFGFTPAVCTGRDHEGLAVLRLLVGNTWVDAAHRLLDQLLHPHPDQGIELDGTSELLDGSDDVDVLDVAARVVEVGFFDPGLHRRLLGALDPRINAAMVAALVALPHRTEKADFTPVSE